MRMNKIKYFFMMCVLISMPIVVNAQLEEPGEYLNISQSEFSTLQLLRLQLLSIAPSTQGQLAYVTGFGTYSNGQYMEVYGREYSRPKTSQTYGCPADPYVQWHLSCYYGCYGTTVNPGTTQGQVNIVLDWTSSYAVVVLSQNFYNSYKLEIEDWILRHPGTTNLYVYGSISGGSGPDSHCYYIQAEQISITPVPTPTPTISPTTQPTPTSTTTPTTTPSVCASGEYELNGKCIRVNPLPGFQTVFAIAGILAIFYLRRKI